MVFAGGQLPESICREPEQICVGLTKTLEQVFPQGIQDRYLCQLLLGGERVLWSNGVRCVAGDLRR